MLERLDGLLAALGPSSQLLLGIAALLVGIVLLGTSLAAARRERKYRVERRLARMVEAQTTGHASSAPQPVLRQTAREADGGSLSMARLAWRVRVFPIPARHRLAAASGLAALGAGAGFASILGPVGLLAGPPVGLGVFEAYLRQLERRRREAFLAQLPNAFQMIVRGIRTGLPLPEAMGIVAREGEQPVADVFQRVQDEMAIGVAPQTALSRAAARVPILEFRFFAVSVAIQNETGGALADTLDNLVGLVRRRLENRNKVAALTAEGRTSAYIVGTLPVLAAVLLSLVNPDYIGRLLESEGGTFALAIAVVAMFAGFLVLNRMTAFKP